MVYRQRMNLNFELWRHASTCSCRLNPTSLHLSCIKEATESMQMIPNTKAWIYFNSAKTSLYEPCRKRNMLRNIPWSAYVIGYHSTLMAEICSKQYLSFLFVRFSPWFIYLPSFVQIHPETKRAKPVRFTCELCLLKVTIVQNLMSLALFLRKMAIFFF